MRPRLFLLQFIFVFVCASVTCRAQVRSRDVELANLQEDVHLLTQRLGEMQLRIEQLERENSELRAKTSGPTDTYATVAQLNSAVADMNRLLKSTIASSKQETLLQVSQQMEKLGHQMNAALDALGSRPAASSSPVAAAPAFSDDYPKEGIKYVVQKGDTLALIAKKTGAKISDIINANKIQNSAKILEGQTLFVPGGK